MTSSLCHRLIGLLTLLLWLGTCVPALAHHTAQHEIPLLRQVDFVQRLHEFIPLDLVLWDETGKASAPCRTIWQEADHSQSGVLRLSEPLHYGAQRPAQTLRALSLTAGDDFDVLVVSINPHDTPAPGCG